MNKKGVTEKQVKKGNILNQLALVIPLTVLFAATLILGFYTILRLKGDATAVNYAGQLRYRSYQLALLVNEYPKVQEGAKNKARGKIIMLLKEFEEILYGLRDGNKDLGLKGFKLPPKIKEGVFEYDNPWWNLDRHVNSYKERIKPYVLHILETNTPEEASLSLKMYNKEVPTFVSEIDNTVYLLASLSEKKITAYTRIEFVFLGLFLAIVGLLAWRLNLMAVTIQRNLKEIQSKNNLLDEVLGNIGSFVRIVDPKTNKVHFQNKPLKAVYPQGLERPCYTLLGRETRCEVCTSTEAIDKKRHCVKEETLNGTTYEVNSFPLPEPDGTINRAIEVVKDVTANKAMSKELEESKAKVQNSHRMATMGYLSSGIAHYLYNPLSGVTMGIDLLIKKVEEVKDGPIYGELKDNLARIREASTRCETVVKDLRTISNLPKLKKRPINVNEVVERALILLAPQVESSKIQLRKEFAPTALSVLGSDSQLVSVFTNLLSNAIENMPGGGSLTVKTERVPDRDRIEITTSDTGRGIDKKDLPHLFDPYFILRVRPTTKGTGLELSIAQFTIQYHEGTIEVDSEVGKGTTFKVRLPLYQGTPTEKESRILLETASN
jgi:signal transduction histidine kinase